MNRRSIAAAVLATALLIPGLMGAAHLFGWGDDGAGNGTDPNVRALRDFVTVLDNAEGQTFTAWYTTGTGVSVTHVQEPPRQVYRSAAGLYLAGPDATYLCRTTDGEKPRCERGEGTDEIPLAQARALTGVIDDKFVAPPLIGAYLSRLAVNGPRQVTRSQRVVAGQNSDCVAIPQVFVACATRSGVLTYFEAPDARLTMTGYLPTVAPELFALPRGATVHDAAAADGE